MFKINWILFYKYFKYLSNFNLVKVYYHQNINKPRINYPILHVFTNGINIHISDIDKPFFKLNKNHQKINKCDVNK